MALEACHPAWVILLARSLCGRALWKISKSLEVLHMEWVNACRRPNLINESRLLQVEPLHVLGPLCTQPVPIAVLYR